MSTPRNTAHATVGGPPPSGTSTAGRTARLIGRRLLGLVVSLAVASIIIFALLSLLPGDVAQVMLGSNADPKMAAQLREQLGLDDPFLVRYWHWLSGLLTGDLGTSVLSGQEIAPQIAERLAVTGWLVLLAVLIALLLCIPMGVHAAIHRRDVRGFLTSALAQFLMSVPAFLAGLLLILLFAIELRWLPAGAYVPLRENPEEWIRHLILPALALALVQAAVMSRYVRSAFIDVLTDDYLRTARAAGWTLHGALRRHGRRNASISLVTVLGLEISSMLVGAIVVEQVFVVPGLGSFLLDAVTSRDIPVVADVVMVLVALVLLISFLSDVVTVSLDPRLRVVKEASK